LKKLTTEWLNVISPERNSWDKEKMDLQPCKGLNLFIYDIQPFAGLLFIVPFLPRIPSGAINLKSLQDFKNN
jgi:hypothetical protein